jgi:hypothetical protein
MVKRLAVSGLVLVVAAVACSSGTGLRTYPFGGQWAMSDLNGYVLTDTESASSFSGQVLGTDSSFYGSVSGTVANGVVSFGLTYFSGGGSGTLCNPSTCWVTEQFTGQFTDANTVVGTMAQNGQSAHVTLTRIGAP